MPRFLTNDFLNKDPRALWTAEKAATISDIVTQKKEYITPTSTDTVTIDADCVISISGSGVFKTEATAVGAGNLDAGTFQVGKDYYIYMCDPGGDNNEKYVVSLNSTFPLGWNSTNSRKIGGFHYGVVRRIDSRMRPVNTNDEAYGTGWESCVYNAIVPRSVWTLHHRPKCNPEGMTYSGGGTWVDIYKGSDDGLGGLASVYNATPATGTEGLNWYGFNERYFAVGKRLPTYAEFCQYAMGSPGGLDDSNENAWTMKTNTARQINGYVRNAVSSIGCRDAVGNVLEWMDEFVTRAQPSVVAGNGTWGAHEGGRAGKAYENGNGHGTAASPTWAWDKYSPFGDGFGNIYQYGDYSLIALVAGGYWPYGVLAGARCVLLASYPWIIYTGIGARGACDSL